MFERFTNRARRAIVLAEEEARLLAHSFIGPEHLLAGLVHEGDGVAAQVLENLGVTLESVRDKMAETVRPAKAQARMAKVPFSPQGKKVLEYSLREALRLGHNYIGTEHILLGVARVAEDGGTVMRSLGIGADEVRARVVAALATLPNGPGAVSPRSHALVEAMRRARELAGSGPMTTGQLVLAMLADDACQAAKALETFGVTSESLEARIAQIPVDTTSDAPPRPRAVEIRLGELTTTIDDPDLVAALGELTPEQLGAALRDALGTPKRRARGKDG